MEEIGGEEEEDNVFEDNTGRGEEDLSDMQVHQSTCTFIYIRICIIAKTGEEDIICTIL